MNRMILGFQMQIKERSPPIITTLLKICQESELPSTNIHHIEYIQDELQKLIKESKEEFV